MGQGGALFPILPLLGLPQVVSDREPEKMNTFLEAALQDTNFHKYVTSHVNKRRKQHVFQCLFLSAAVSFVFRDLLVDDFWPCT